MEFRGTRPAAEPRASSRGWLALTALSLIFVLALSSRAGAAETHYFHDDWTGSGLYASSNRGGSDVDRQGNYYVATDNGIFKFDPSGDQIARFGTSLGGWLAKAAAYQTAQSEAKPWPFEA